jgi:hypothetical protein
MLNSKLLKLLNEKAIVWGDNNPAKAILNQLNNVYPMNPILSELLKGKELELKDSDLDKDEQGFSLVDYASVIGNTKFVEKYIKDEYLPVIGEYNLDLSKPLFKNLSFDKKIIVKGQNFFLHSKYDFLECKNFNEALKKIFPNAGKKTFKTISNFIENENGNIDFSAFHFAHYCSVYVSDANHFNEIIENSINLDSVESLHPLHFVLERMNEKRFIKLVIDATRVNKFELSSMVIDIMRMYKDILKVCEEEYEIDFKSINTVKELHDSVMKDHELISRHGENLMLFLERKFPYLEAFSENEFRGCQIVIPKDKATLVEWGQQLGNCIGSYGQDARDGQTIIFALYEKDKVKYNIEISPSDGRIKQFVSHSNNIVDENMRNELQELIARYCEGRVVSNEDGEIINLNVDRRFLVRVLKTDSPVNEEKVFLNKLFQLEFSSKKTFDNFIDVKRIGFGDNIPKGIMSLILEDKTSKGALCNKIASLESSAYTGLLKQFKGTDFINMRVKDYREVVVEIKNNKKKGVRNFFIGVDKLLKVTGKTPSAMQSQDYTEFKKLIDKELDDKTNIFLVISDVKKNKRLVYKDDKIIEPLVNQIFFTHKDKSIDTNFKVDVIKNLSGESNCVYSVK